MKALGKLKAGLFAGLIGLIMLPGCIVVDNTPGPRGFDGVAYFGADYDHYRPYSYWDNNPNFPYNASYGTYYPTLPGIYDFEYFVNPYEYWFGTYEIWVNAGGPGGSYGERGFDGADSYLMLVCNPNGYGEFRADGYYKNGEAIPDDEPLVIERKEGDLNYRITIQKAHIDQRTPKKPKMKNEAS